MHATHDVLALPVTDQRRLEKLAREAGRTPKAMLRIVLRDGFDYTERFVKDVQKGLAEADAGETVSHAEVSRQLDAHLKGKHGVRTRKAA